MNIQELMGSSLLTGQMPATIVEAARAAQRKRNLWIGGIVAVVLIGGGVGYALWKRRKSQDEEKKENRRRQRRYQPKSNPRGSHKRAARKSNPKKRVDSSHYKLKPTTDVQTLIFPKPKFTEASAVSWAKEHGFKTDKVDETGSSFRLRQLDPGRAGPRTFRTIAFGDSGIKAVVAKKKRYKEAA